MTHRQTDLPTIHQRVRVAFDYPVHFTSDAFALDNPLLADVLAAGPPAAFQRTALAFVDAEVARLHPRLLADIGRYIDERTDYQLAAPPESVPGGEACKNATAGLQHVMDRIADGRLCRQSMILAVGGGALLDMVGYAAATAHRGIPLVRVPTTVLAQNDAGLAVKNGVNAYGKKNFVGSFTPPRAVICDAAFLATLPTRDWIAGVAECVKVSLLKDPDFFDFIEAHVAELKDRDLDVMRRIIHRCARLHLDHIATSGDPFETGSSRPLDFGHWAAHRLEHLTDYNLRHGEAVAIGLALDSTYSFVRGLLPEAAWTRILHTLAALGLPIYAAELAEGLDDPKHPRSILAGLDDFREHLGGQLTIMLLQAIGDGVEVHEMDRLAIKKSVAILAEHPLP